MPGSGLLPCLLLAFLVSAPAGSRAAASEAPLPQAEAAPPGGDFTLRSMNGPVALSDFRGKLVFLYFGYMRCPDVCPISLAYLSRALYTLSEPESQQVSSIFVSLDPDRDEVEGLAEYAAYYHPGMLGVTGSGQEVARVARMYGVRYYQVQLEGSAFGYAVNHSAATYLLSAQGEIRFIFPYQTPAQILVDAARYLLAGN